MTIFAKIKIKSRKKKLASMYKNRQSNNVSDAALKKEIALLYDLAALYDKNKLNKHIPHAEQLALETYRAAASLNDINAQYIVGMRLLEQGKFWEGLRHSFWANKIHDKYAEEKFKEAYHYLNSAEAAGNPLAKRLKGVALINGWGVSKDSDHGFQLIVESIDQEGSWDRATKLFEELHLNKPEFFSSIMSAKKSRHGG